MFLEQNVILKIFVIFSAILVAFFIDNKALMAEVIITVLYFSITNTSQLNKVLKVFVRFIPFFSMYLIFGYIFNYDFISQLRFIGQITFSFFLLIIFRENTSYETFEFDLRYITFPYKKEIMFFLKGLIFSINKLFSIFGKFKRLEDIKINVILEEVSGITYDINSNAKEFLDRRFYTMKNLSCVLLITFYVILISI